MRVMSFPAPSRICLAPPGWLAQGRRQVCKSGGAGMLLRCKYLDIPPPNAVYSNIIRSKTGGGGGFSPLTLPLSTPLLPRTYLYRIIPLPRYAMWAFSQRFNWLSSIHVNFLTRTPSDSLRHSGLWYNSPIFITRCNRTIQLLHIGLYTPGP